MSLGDVWDVWDVCPQFFFVKILNTMECISFINIQILKCQFYNDANFTTVPTQRAELLDSEAKDPKINQ